MDTTAVLDWGHHTLTHLAPLSGFQTHKVTFYYSLAFHMVNRELSLSLSLSLTHTDTHTLLGITDNPLR